MEGLAAVVVLVQQRYHDALDERVLAGQGTTYGERLLLGQQPGPRPHAGADDLAAERRRRDLDVGVTAQPLHFPRGTGCPEVGAIAVDHDVDDGRNWCAVAAYVVSTTFFCAAKRSNA